MTIEATLERIADALEILAGSAAPVSTPKAETPKAETPKAEKPKAEKPKATKPKAKEETTDDAPDIGAVREALKTLQKATDAATAKGVLESFEVSTLSALDEGLYADVIAAAVAAAE